MLPLNLRLFLPFIPLALFHASLVRPIEPEDAMEYSRMMRQMRELGPVEPPPAVMLRVPNVTEVERSGIWSEERSVRGEQKCDWLLREEGRALSEEHVLASWGGWQFVAWVGEGAGINEKAAEWVEATRGEEWVMVEREEVKRCVNVGRMRRDDEEKNWEVLSLEFATDEMVEGEIESDRWLKERPLGLRVTENGKMHVVLASRNGLRYWVGDGGKAMAAGKGAWNRDLFGKATACLPGLEDDTEGCEILSQAVQPVFIAVEGGLALDVHVRGDSGLRNEAQALFMHDTNTETWKRVGQYLLGSKDEVRPISHLRHAERFGWVAAWTNQYQPGIENNQIFFAESYDGKQWTAGKPETGAQLEARIQRAIVGEPSQQEKPLVGLSASGTMGLDRFDSGAALTSADLFESGAVGAVSDIDFMCIAMDDVNILARDLSNPDKRGCGIWRHYRRCGISRRWSVHDFQLAGVCPKWDTARGKVLSGKGRTLFFVLQVADILFVLKRRVRWVIKVEYNAVEVVWQGKGYTGEPQVDEAALRKHGIISVITRSANDGKLVVLDFQLAKADMEWDYAAMPNRLGKL